MERKGQRTPLDAITRIIAIRLYRYNDIKKAIHDARLDGGSNTKTIIPRHAFVSDTTANTAVKNLSEIKCVTLDDGVVITHPETWIKVIDWAYQHMNEQDKNVITMRYNQGYKTNVIAYKMAISQTMVYNINNEAINLIAMCACENGLIRIMGGR